MSQFRISVFIEVARAVFAVAAVASLVGCATEPTAADFVACDLHGTVLSSPALAAGVGDIVGTPCKLTLPTFQALVISGGGADGAFGSAFLATVLQTHRTADVELDKQTAIVPHPCLVTGISTGAVIAPYAYLATSNDQAIATKYVHQLRDIYANFDDSWLLTGSTVRIITHDALHNVSGIQAEIMRRLEEGDGALMRDIQTEYRRTGRTLIVGATDLYSGNFEVIDLTRYVASSGPQTDASRLCMAEAIRASAAIPVEFPPVPIKDGSQNKLYVDGGVAHMVFLDTQLYVSMNPPTNAGVQKPVLLFGIVNNTYATNGLLDAPNGGPPLNVKAVSILDVATRSAALAASQLAKDSTWLTNSAIRDHVTTRWIDATSASSCKKADPSKLFDHTYETCLINAGEVAAREKSPWKELGPVITVTQ